MSQQTPFGGPQQPGGPAAFAHGQPHQKAPGGGGTVKILLIIGGILGVFSLLCCGGCVMLMNMGGNALADSARQSYSNHPDVVANVGEDATFNWSLMDAAKAVEYQDDGRQRQAFRVEGSKGTGLLFAVQTGTTVSNGILVMDDGTVYQLDGEAQAEADPAGAFE